MAADVIRRHTYGQPLMDGATFIGSAALQAVEPRRREDWIRVIRQVDRTAESLDGYGGVVTDASREECLRGWDSVPVRAIYSAEHLEHIQEGDVLKVDFEHGFVRSLYRTNSLHNVIFATDRCNSNCLMCSQPPRDIDDSHVIDEHLRLISLIPPTTKALCITGGEPTLLGEGLLKIVKACKESLPVTKLHMLTNGRLFYYRRCAEDLARVAHPDLTLGIPLYSDRAAVHDYVVQAVGAFDQTMVGFHNLARCGLNVEVRVVVHKQTYDGLPRLAEFIYRNCPFAVHVAFMGLELMGYTKTNLAHLWIDPIDYQGELEEAVIRLVSAGMNVSIYNHQLCVLPRSLWPYARKSISDFKNIYLDECRVCSVLERCGGLFKSAEHIHSRGIAPILE